MKRSKRAPIDKGDILDPNINVPVYLRINNDGRYILRCGGSKISLTKTEAIALKDKLNNI